MVTSIRLGVGMKRRNYMFIAASMIALVAAESASAQSVPTDTTKDQVAQAIVGAQSIVVTGTQIRGVAPVGAPVLRVDRDEINLSGATSTSDILHDLPQVTSIGAGAVYTGTNENGFLNTSRDNAINIRGLQPQATLVLLDGRRTPNGGTTGQLFDPSSIPTIALSGIDLLTGGASATYGSDAVAGVANLTLRKNFDGLEAQATYGAGIGFHTENFSGIFGHKWNTGSVMVAYENSNGSELLNSARPNLYGCNPGVNACSLFNPTYGNVKIGTTTYSVPTAGTGSPSFSQLTPGATYYNPANDAAILPKTNRNSVVFSAQQEITNNIHAWAEGYFTAKDNSFPSGSFTITGPVGAHNPGFITGAPPGAQTASVSLDNYGGPEERTGLERAYQAAGGFDIALPHDWALNVYGEHNYNYARVDTSAFNTAVESQVLSCANPALCFDPFGPNPNNASAINQIIGEQYTNYWQKENVFDAKFDGPLFALPGGEVKLAVGGEIQHNTLQVLSDNNTASPNLSVVHIASQFTAGRTISSAYAETIIPIFGAGNRVPLFQSLVIDAAIRYDHYSDVGSTTNPKVSFNWKPVSDLALHGEFGTSFRAPTLCDTNPNCTGTAQQSTTAIPGYDLVQILGGNSSVKPETSTTFDFGATYRPSKLPGLSLTADYYGIDYRKVIGTPGASAASSVALFNNPAYASVVNTMPTAAYVNYLVAQPWFVQPTLFQLFTASGAVNPLLAIVNGERFNAGSILTHGVDFTADYKFNNHLGAWSLGIKGTYVINYNYQVFTGQPVVKEVNFVNFPTRWRFRTKASWSLHDLTLAAFVNYTGGYDNNSGTDNIANARVSPYATVDVTAVYKLPLEGVAKNTTISVTALNVGNAAPPYALTTSTQEFDAQQASPLGRVVNITLKKAF